MHVDIRRVRGKMAERGYNITSLSNQLGINRNTLSVYLSNPEKMPYGVITGLADALCEDECEARSIFFA